MKTARYNQTGVEVRDLHKSVKAPRDRPVLTTTVECPDCGAPEKERCRSIVTGELSTPHRVRRRMALRKEQGW